MPLPTETQVLVVGAGPTGMACALTLVGLGLQVTVVDALPKNRDDCRAVVIHARTLEVLKTVGMAKPLLDIGLQARGAAINSGTNRLMEIDIGVLRGETEFPFALLIPQDDIESILRKKLIELGVQILRPHAVVGIKEVPSGHGVDVTFDDGSIIRSDYVVGADGVKSTIRRVANIDYRDPTTGIDYDGEAPSSLTYRIALADVYFDEPLPASIPRDAISFQLGKFFLLCPLPSGAELKAKKQSRWRIVIASIPGGPSPPRNPDITWLQRELDDRSPWEAKLRIASVLSSSRYRARAGVASTFFKKIGGGKILLVGDAAHAHSPAAGQGLNVGFCDAVALGHAIEAHTRAGSEYAEEAGDAALSTYSASRRKIAIKVAKMAGGMTAIVNIPEGWRATLRNILFWIVGKTPLTRILAWRVSGLVHRGV